MIVYSQIEETRAELIRGNESTISFCFQRAMKTILLIFDFVHMCGLGLMGSGLCDPLRNRIVSAIHQYRINESVASNDFVIGGGLFLDTTPSRLASRYTIFVMLNYELHFQLNKKIVFLRI